jgi:UDP-N-acetylglucosamine 1-carboxyvinyltransferase
MPRLTFKGGIPLIGTVAASGAKNSALPLLSATLMMSGETVLTNVPHLEDIRMMIRMLTSLGVHTEYQSSHRIRISNVKKVKHIAPYELVTAMRASFFVAGPILAKTGYAKIPLPGGCLIGKRPVDIHLYGFKALGAKVNLEHGFVGLTATQLKGAPICFPFPSVGATENVMMAACLAEGDTLIENAAREPEIEDLAGLLNQAGAKIEGAGSSKIQIQGVTGLHGVDVYPVISDRVEVGTLLIAAAITGGDITVTHVEPLHVKPLLDVLEQCGCQITISESTIRCCGPKRIAPVHIKTQPFPGFPTDMQAQLMALLTIADGVSTIEESVFENRFMHVPELNRMGAIINIEGSIARITGVSQLSGTEVKITDLRAGAALILAGLVASGQTTVHGLKHLYRGYDQLPQKLASLGAKIQL